MAHLPRLIWAPGLTLTWIALATTARGASPDTRSLGDMWEEQVQDGDIDTEDLAGFRLARRGEPSARRPGAYVAVQAFGGERLAGQTDLGVMVVLQLPLERWASGALPPFERAPLAASTDFAAPDPPADRPPVFGFLQDAGAPTPAAPAPVMGTPTAPLVVTSELARSCVRAAWRTLGLADDSRLDSLASRARASAALPELRLRLARTIDESGRLTLTDADPNHYTEVGGATNWIEARLTFRLDRLLFADDEISLERLRVDRSEQRSRTAAKVIQALFEWQRAFSLTLDPGSSSDEHLAAVLRELEARSILDVMTDGWFGRLRAVQQSQPK